MQKFLINSTCLTIHLLIGQKTSVQTVKQKPCHKEAFLKGSILRHFYLFLLFLFVFTEDIGLLNNILKAVGLEEWTTAWLANMNTVKPTVVIVQTWRQFGLTMILCFAGLQGISNELIESARLDGAGDGRIFTRILLPLIKPQIELATMFTLLNGLKIYDSVVSLTGGGPSRQTVVLPMWIIENAFTYSNFGYASAMCIAFIIVVLIFNIVLRTVFRGENYEY